MPRNMSIDEQLKGLSSHTPAMDASDNVAAVGSRHGSINEASPYPATITEGFLWLGDHKHASTDGVMRDLKITHVVMSLTTTRPARSAGPVPGLTPRDPRERRRVFRPDGVRRLAQIHQRVPRRLRPLPRSLQGRQVALGRFVVHHLVADG